MHQNNKVLNCLLSSIIGILVAIIISFILSIGTVLLIEKDVIAEENIYKPIFIIRLISVICGCVLSALLSKNAKLIHSISVMTGYVIILLVIGVIVSKSSQISYGSVILSALLGYLIFYGIQLQRRSKKKYVKKYIR